MAAAKSSPLSDTQLVILSSAAARDDHRVLPPPASVKARGAALKRVLESLLRAGLVGEHQATVDDEVWRTGENDGRWTLAISPAGLSAIEADADDYPDLPTECGSQSTERAQTSSPDGDRSTEASPTLARPGSKSAIVAEMLRASGGASIDDLMEATGWQAHSVRGFLSGTLKKKLGYTITSERQDGVRRYRIPA